MKLRILYHQITALILLAALMAQSFSRTIVLAEYYTNQAKFAKNCENKARPKMNCNGKCQLMKKLKQQEKKDNENPERKLENKNEIILSRRSYFAVDAAGNQGLVLLKQIAPYTASRPIDQSFDIFHPPRV